MAEVTMEDKEATARRHDIDLSNVDVDSIQLPPGEDFGIKSDEELYQEDPLEFEAGFGNVIMVDNCTIAADPASPAVDPTPAANPMTLRTNRDAPANFTLNGKASFTFNNGTSVTFNDGASFTFNGDAFFIFNHGVTVNPE